MLTVLDNRDARERERLTASDPFQLAQPCWRVRPILPAQRESTLEERNYMPLRTVAVQEAPGRLHGTRMSTNTDYNDVLDAFKNVANKGKAFVVTMADPHWTEVKNGQPVYPKPEISFAYTLRRFFETQGVAMTAYQSGKMEITIRPKTAAEQVSRKRKK